MPNRAVDQVGPVASHCLAAGQFVPGVSVIRALRRTCARLWGSKDLPDGGRAGGPRR
jgi:hypothetical protein